MLQVEVGRSRDVVWIVAGIKMRDRDCLQLFANFLARCSELTELLGKIPSDARAGRLRAGKILRIESAEFRLVLGFLGLIGSSIKPVLGKIRLNGLDSSDASGRERLARL